MSDLTLLIIVLCGLILGPPALLIFLYFGIKLGRYAYLQATDLFEREHSCSVNPEEKRNGDS